MVVVVVAVALGRLVVAVGRWVDSNAADIAVSSSFGNGKCRLR